VLAALHTAGVHLRRGRPRSAAQAVEAAGPLAGDLLGAPTAAIQALCAALLGDGEGASAHLERARAWRRPGSIYDPFADEAEAWTFVANGQPEAGRRAATASLEAGLAAHRWGQAADLAHSLARIGGVEIAHEAMERIGDRVDGRFAATNRAHVAALLADDADGLETVLKTFLEIGAELLAAESAAEAARAARRKGDPRRATRLMRLAKELALRCEGARTPALVLPEDELSPLSRRELEVADLAATGLSSEEIAGRLFLSVRTVDNHLQHVYQKLGIASRQELAQVLGRRSVRT